MALNGLENSDTEKLVTQFIAMTLPKSQWTHEAHLRVGLWHVLNDGADEALLLLRNRIRAYNESVGTPNTDTSGYHETITHFYLLLIARFLSGVDHALPLDQMADQLISQYGNRKLLLKYYSRERLFSATARQQWIDPDLIRLPEYL